MEKKTIIIIVSVIAGAVAATGLGVLIWWLLRDTVHIDEFTIIELDGEGIGAAEYTAAFTRIHDVGDIFWWFYPSTAAAAATRPILLWLDGVTGIPPSLLANFGMFGPYDSNLNARGDSWVDEFNLLFVDAPLGTGFSRPEDESKIPSSLDENVKHLIHSLNSFYKLHGEYINTPLHIVGQGSGAQLALQLAIQLSDDEFSQFSHNLQGVVIANGIVSPALVLTKLGFYLEELGYIDYVGRAAVESFSNETTSMVNEGRYDLAFDKFLSLEDYVNDAGETVAVNLGYIVEKLTRTPERSSRVPDYFNQKKYLTSIFLQDLYSFMDETVAHALGIHDTVYDYGRLDAVQAARSTFMVPAVDKVEYILQNTLLTVTIYNGNLDAVSNTPGQLEWVDNLNWDGQQEFINSNRQTLVVNRLVEGYFRETSRLKFYWINAAGQWAPMDSPAAMRRVMQRITADN